MLKKLLLAMATFAFLAAAQAKADEPKAADDKKPMKKSKKSKKAKKAKKADDTGTTNPAK